MTLPRQAVILVGGLGSRLGELTRNTPKPLIPVGGLPFLEYLVEQVGRHGCDELLLLAQFEPAQIEDFVRTSPAIARFGITAQVAIEPEKAGTGGALWWAREHLRERFFLLNGDSWTPVNLLGLAHDLERDGTIGVIAAKRVDSGARFGALATSGNRVSAFQQNEVTGEALINAGIYALDRSVIELAGPSCSLEHEVFPGLADAGKLGFREVSGAFIDIGVPEALAEAQSMVDGLFRPPALFLDRDGVLNHDHGYVGSVERFEWIEGAREAVLAANEVGWLVFVVTNQAGVARGFYGEDDVKALHRHMQAGLAEVGAHIDDFRYCPDHPEGTVERYRRSSDWRKPGTGMIDDLFSQWRIDHARSLLIGDKDSDMTSGAAAGLRTARFTGGNLRDFLAGLADGPLKP